MKTEIMNGMSIRFACVLVAVVLIGIIGCNEETSFEPITKQRAYLHFLHAYSGVGAVNVSFETFGEEQNVAERVKFLDSWPNNGYASILTSPDTSNGLQGAVNIRIYDVGEKKELVPAIYNNLRGDERYTFILVDSFSKPIVVRAIDNVDAETPAAYVRLMNVNRYATSVSLETTQGEVVIRNLNYLNYSGYQNMEPGRYSFYFVDDKTGNRLDSVKNVNLRFNQTYSFYLTHDTTGSPLGGLKIMESITR